MDRADRSPYFDEPVDALDRGSDVARSLSLHDERVTLLVTPPRLGRIALRRVDASGAGDIVERVRRLVR